MWAFGTLPKKKLTKCQVFMRGVTLPMINKKWAFGAVDSADEED